MPRFLGDEDLSTTFVLDLLDQATSGVYLWKTEHDQVQWSPKLVETLGYRADEGGTYGGIEELVHPDDQSTMTKAIAGSRATKSVYRVQLRIRNAEGAYLSFDVHGVWLQDSQDHDLLLGFVTDITHVEEARQAVRRSAALLRAFFDNAPGAVYLKTRDHRHVYCNQTAADMMGVNLEDLLAKTGEAVFSEETAHTYADADRRVLDTRETIVWTGDVETSDGSRLHLVDTKFPVEDPETGEVMVGGFGIDISRQHAAEQAVARAQKMEAVGQLVAGVAHDFNNTLAIILGSLELLDDPRDEDEAELRRAAVNAVESGGRLITQLLAFARQSPLNTETLSLNKLVEKLGPILQRIIPENIRIETVTNDGLWSTDVDLAQAENALLNLALNARDAMPDGGRLTIETSNVRVGSDDVEERYEQLRPGPYVVLSVTDTGTGMTVETLERAFEPFYTTKSLGEGTGMGLSMVYGLMRQLNGAARVSSEQGVGTTIQLFFPGAVNSSPAERESADTWVEDGTERVLLVEDNELLRRTLERQVKSLGYQLTVADSGDAAWELLENGLMVDLLVTDVVMPGSLMGTHLAQRARSISPTLPVVFLSGYPAEAMEHGSGLDPQEIILMKPVPLEMLSKEMRRALDRREVG